MSFKLTDKRFLAVGAIVTAAAAAYYLKKPSCPKAR